MTHGVGFVDHVGVECMCGDTFDFGSGRGWPAFNDHLATVIAESTDRNMLKYGDHTRRCALRRYPTSNLYGDPRQAGIECSCGWDALISPIVDAEIAKLRAVYATSPDMGGSTLPNT